MSGRTAATPNLLDAIVAATRARVAAQRERESMASLERRAAARRPNGAGFRAALADRERINVIAECKRRSPSRGVLRRDYDAVAIARGYAAAGAAALSVLTEPMFFDGSLEHLSQVREAVEQKGPAPFMTSDDNRVAAVSRDVIKGAGPVVPPPLPLLRKDFVVEDYQLLETRAAGADAVLLIVAALADRALARLRARAAELGLAVLVEVHDADEVPRALDAGAELIGVNNRNLRTLDVDVRASEACAARIPSHVIAVSESGLKTADDLRRMRGLGYRAFLIGERFMTAADPGDALRTLLATLNDGSPTDRDVAP